MSTKTFEIQIITPERQVYSGSATSLVLPASDGLMGVLVNHAPIIAALDLGQVTVTTEAGKVETMMVSDGFFEMSDNKARILADSGECAADIDKSRAKKAEERARGRLAKRGHTSDDDELDFIRAERALQRALWRQRISS